MCGLTGFISAPGRFERPEEVVGDMALTLAHRGPDDAGVWCDPAAGIAVGHQRLAIVDLSPAGHQPMLSANGRFVLAYNGEIYNHGDIRAELGGDGAPSWRGHSDTETILAAIERWGFKTTLQKMVGMFAIALWDRRERTLHLARDRLGEKPLYYGWVEGALVFASELKAIRRFPGFRNAVSRQALAQYLRLMYVPAPHSIYEDVYKLEPGCLLSISEEVPSLPMSPLRAPQVHGKVFMERWWSPADAVDRGAASVIHDEREALEQLEQHLRTAVASQSLADVPLGAFLSGGVDSSTIIALLQQQSSRPVQTFTVGFEEADFDESPYAAAVARHLGTEHHELKVTAKESQAVISQLPRLYDEPFADSSQIPTHLVCRAARQHVTVALSGDAGDELFGGYNRYFWAPKVWNKVAWLPLPVRRALGASIGMVPIPAWDAMGTMVNRAGGSDGISRLGDKAHKLAARLGRVKDVDDLYLSLVSEWQCPSDILLQHSELIQDLPSSLRKPAPLGAKADSERMMFWDTVTYLPDDILCKVDRAAMTVGLETRVPFLDHRVYEFSWRLPLSMKIRGNEGKWALRQILYHYVPRELIDRPKAGFGIPVGTWLRGPLRAWAEDLLSIERIVRDGYFRHEPIRAAWTEHLSGRRDWTAKIWSVLMFQAWLAEQV